ncbi:phosphatidate cytidylyltransferase [Candidatus Venteria ishoeyi]|uniref:Phosphatidate cytidylyltransferase n=1 Tax=Candidatus Venteria ishoeyi TaxID=1899563 RepID=A0A1H6F719_9GAMM|nr:phosphatidate cytidylyltransferase [Candidatus Venteria ishoeyi]SEH05940.1 Phosphatidate cytidylyltransferase [Candidatus Venteria ishoeyi]
MLKQRILTALILIPLVVLAILYLPTTTLMLLFAVVLGLAAWEWSRIAGWQETVGQLFYVAAMALNFMGLKYLPDAAG